MEDQAPTQSPAWDSYYSQEQSSAEGEWVECTSDNGEMYYTNVVTGETSWTKPGSELEQNDQTAVWAENPTEGDGEYTQWEAAETLVDVENGTNASMDMVDEVVQWLELFDPAQHAIYYFAPQSGEVRWESPPEGTAFVRHCDSEAVLSAIISLQSAARSQQARARITTLRQEKHLEHPSGENHNANLQTSGTGAAQLSEQAQWVEVYDPAMQQQYYYSPRTNETRWDAPEIFVNSSEDRKAAAAISIQSLSRGRHARKQVHELRERVPQHEYHQQHLHNLLKDDSEREAMCRQEMNHQELHQLKGGDRFWGLDAREREALQLRLGQEILALSMDGQRASIRSPHSGSIVTTIPPIEYLEFEDVEDVMDSERLQRELQDEQDACIAMSNEEAHQCQNGDSFWGIQAEEARQEKANIVMAEEEAASRRFAESVVEQALSATWEAEVVQNATKELAARGGQEQRIQARYLRWFYSQCISVDELLDYRWPTKQQQETLEEASSSVKKRRQPVAQPYEDIVGSATPYPLDDIVFRERLEYGDLRYGLRSTLTVHQQGIHGTKGTHFEITMAPPECAFDEPAAAARLKSEFVAFSSDQQGESSFDDRHERQEVHTGGGDLTPGSSVNYRRSEIPDPHIPARFNGVPYKPNQISPTRDILRGDHRKVNQLPSLSRSNPTTEATKLRQSKTKTRIKSKVPGEAAQQQPNNGNNSTSTRGLEVNIPLTDTTDEGPRAQFKRQEHQVLSRLFALMDLDGSGTVNQSEMRWALQRDAEIHSLAKTSPLLRLLLKQRTRLEALFSCKTTDDGNAGIATRDESSDELSWEEFLARCEHSYACLMSEGLIQPDAITTTSRAENRLRGNHAPNSYEYANPAEREAETRTIRRVFALLDIDQNGVVDVAEVQRALYNSAVAAPRSASRPSSTGAVSKELRTLVEGSRVLQPMLHQELFMTAFTKFEPLDPRGISEEEFVAFCLEIAQVAAANNMVSA